MKIQAVIPAAGVGARLKSVLPKPLVLLGGKPVIFYSLNAFQKCSLIQSVILVVPRRYLAVFEKNIRQYRLTKVTKIIAGGATRRESVWRGLCMTDADTRLVVIHDAARPFVTLRLIKKSIAAALQTKAAVAAVPAKSTIKTVDTKAMNVKKTLDRNSLWEIQTPQVFEKSLILKAHKTMKDRNPSDDSLLVEKMGKKVKVVVGDYRNIKITTQEDLSFARMILSMCRP